MTMDGTWKRIAAVAATLCAGPALAGGPDAGCYARSYSPAHLAKTPSQVVERMVMEVRRQGGGDVVAEMWVLLARQGHALKSGHGGQALHQVLTCWTEAAVPVCGVECDGGLFAVTRQDGQGLTLRTDRLMVGDTDGCGGTVDLAEVPGQAVSYRLNRVAQSVCDDAW